MKTIEKIFNQVALLNAETTISSLGRQATAMDQQLADNVYNEILKNIPESSLAAKILTSTTRYSEKQLWVIAYELMKNASYVAEVEKQASYEERLEAQREAEHKAKLANNKANSQEVLDYVKANNRLLKDYYSFVKGSKLYKKEFFSKKFSLASAEAFLNI